MGGRNKYSKFTLFQTKHILNIYFVSELSLARFTQSSGAMEITARYECLYTVSKVEKMAACKNCDTVYSFDPQLTGYKTLREHYWNKHSDHFSEFVRKRKPQGPASGAPITKFFPQSSAEVEQKQKIAIAYCVEKHSLPLNIYEDKCNEWALGIKMTSENSRSEIKELYGELRKQMLCKLENLRTKFLSVLMAVAGRILRHIISICASCHSKYQLTVCQYFGNVSSTTLRLHLESKRNTTRLCMT